MILSTLCVNVWRFRHIRCTRSIHDTWFKVMFYFTLCKWIVSSMSYYLTISNYPRQIYIGYCFTLHYTPKHINLYIFNILQNIKRIKMLIKYSNIFFGFVLQKSVFLIWSQIDTSFPFLIGQFMLLFMYACVCVRSSRMLITVIFVVYYYISVLNFYKLIFQVCRVG